MAKLRADLHCAESEICIFKNQKNLFDFARCWSILNFRTLTFLTPRSLTLRGCAEFFREYICEDEFVSKIILDCLQEAQMEAQMGSIHEIKKYKKIS